MRSKFILSFLLLILVPLLALGIVMQVKGSFSFLDQNSKHIVNTFDSYISNIESFLNLSSKNDVLINLLENIHESRIQNSEYYVKAADILNDTSRNIRSPEFISVYFLKDNQVYPIYCKYSNSIPRNNVFGKRWHQDVVKNPGKVKFIGTSLQFFGQGKEEYVFSAAKALINPQTGKETGLLLVDFSYNTLDSLIKKSDFFQGSGELYIINQDFSNSVDSPPGNTIMYCKSTNLLTSPFDDDILKDFTSSPSQTFLRNIEGKGNCIISFNSQSRLKWNTVYLFPLHKAIFYISPISSYWLVIVAACIILILIFPFVVYMVLLKPINRLTSVITEYEKGSFPTKINLDSQNNDASMQPENPESPSNIDNLINKVYFNQLKQKEAELNSLQNKINPHFLYNTLESIRGAALYYGIDSIASMAKSLSLLFRYSINSNVLVTVREEIENLGNYVTIQNFRHDDKFEVMYNIPEKVYSYKMLKLILQPIVENSIKHGLEMKLGKGLIKVTFLDMGSIFKIEISDDGIGIPPDKILELNKLLSEGVPVKSNENSSQSGTGIGIQNVNSRIKLYFGEQYGIKFRETETGTTVEIIIPVVE